MKMHLLSFLLFIGLASSHIERGFRKMYARKQREYETLKLKYIDNPECTDANLMDAARGLANVVDVLNRREGIDPSQDSRWYAESMDGKSRTAHQWMDFVDELVAANKHFDPIIEINIDEENENKVTYQISEYPFAPFEFVERNEDLGIVYVDGESRVVPTETFINAMRIIRPQQLCGSRYCFVVEVDFGRIEGAMENAKLCYLPNSRCSQGVNVENGKVTEIFWGDV